ncbi:MAG: DISARM system helicase DrmA [Waterburya sp.]
MGKKIIELPPKLPGELDLKQINQQLKSGQAVLDWSAVVHAPQKYLKVLLDSLDFERNEDCLGIDGGISESILDAISICFKSLQKSTKNTSGKQLSLTTTSYSPSEVNSGSLLTEKIEIKPDLINSKRSPQISTPQKQILTTATHYDIREELHQLILHDLLGPVNGETEEVEEGSVSNRYLVGVIAPKIRSKNPEEPTEESPEQQDNLAYAGQDDAEEGQSDSAFPPATSMFPSSIGMSFCVTGETKELEITAQWGHYERKNSEISFKEDGSPIQVWKRTPRQGSKVIPLQDGKRIEWVISPQEVPEVFVQGRVRKFKGDWLITVFLVNNQTEPSKLRDSAWLFQPELKLRSADSNHPDIFLRKPLAVSDANLDPVIQQENQAMAMLYRHQVEFAVGHGVAVKAVPYPDNSQRAIALSTTFIPDYEVPQSTTPDLTDLVVDMKQLGEAEPDELISYLAPLTTAYQTWIDQQEQKITNPEELLGEYQEAAAKAIANCRQALTRINEGIKTLQDNPQAVAAFKFMNLAMKEQRIHAIYSEKIRRGETITLEQEDTPNNHSWRPFQLAFILLNLASTTDLHHRDRSHPTNAVTDLLWFPTGGGKTEAYLGLTAYTIALRRLQGKIGGRDGHHGVAVLMRYTLRLLTLQQFQRATTLICACEHLRRQNPDLWGEEPIRIGLWVGNSSTPNYTSQSEEWVKQERSQNSRQSGGTPHQLTNCPWCGTKIEAGKHIQVESFEKGQGRTYVKCGDKLGRCEFSKGEGLPILVVDEEIYRRLPTLLIATVDKFAQMPWKGEIQMLFGEVNGYCQRHGFRSPDIEDADHHRKTNRLEAAKTIYCGKLRPPDLIIQDELHLISGPLGTLVGLYETAVDKLATWEVQGKPVRPKVIASTATIRQAETQVNSLFQRQLQIFPPQGLNIEDNFFSQQNSPTPSYPGRRYLGICAPGRRLKAAIIRVYLAVLAASQSLYEQYGEKADPWMTLVGYFNSLRELGGTRRLVDDDIRNRLNKMEQRGLAKRNRLIVDELTSRKDSTEIPQLLDKLEIPFNPQQEQDKKDRRKAGQRTNLPDPLDVILATNMISVGVDVKRLGVMVACGQPKNTAEYIQATSRVGRSYPGLVITVYNWARPRDLSHYEKFCHYHSTFYQHVEALSVTPFASGALDRGLTALLITLVRLAGEEFNGNDKAGEIERNHPYLQKAIETIIKRAEQLEGRAVRDRLKQELEVKLDRWLNSISSLEPGTTLKYRVSRTDGTAVDLIKPAGQGMWDDFTCLNSLRNVEPTIGLILNDLPLSEENAPLPQPFSNQ